MKKSLSLILAALLCLSLMPVSLASEEIAEEPAMDAITEEVPENCTEEATLAELAETTSNETEVPSTETIEEPVEEPAIDGSVNIDLWNFGDPFFVRYISQEFDSNQDGVLSDVEIGQAMFFRCNNMHISTLWVYRFTEMQILSCRNNEITELDLKQNPTLFWLDCEANQIKTLNISNNPELMWLECSNNQLTRLDISQNPKLKYLRCSGNPLTSLEIGFCPALEDAYLNGQKISGNGKICWLVESDDNTNINDTFNYSAPDGVEYNCVAVLEVDEELNITIGVQPTPEPTPEPTRADS